MCKHRKRTAGSLTVLSTFLGLGFQSCSTPETVPLPIIPEKPMTYLSAPFPQGYENADLNALMFGRDAPDPADIKGCEKDYAKIFSYSASRVELKRAADELVLAEPYYYHWCFFYKMFELESKLHEIPYIKERQDLVLSSYEFLTSIARAFVRQLNETRYLRFAIKRYQKLSEYLFFRKVDLTPAMTQEILEAHDPYGNMRMKTVEETLSVLEKYGIQKNPKSLMSRDEKLRRTEEARLEHIRQEQLKLGTGKRQPATSGDVGPLTGPASGASDSALSSGPTPQESATGDPSNETLREPSSEPSGDAGEVKPVEVPSILEDKAK